MSISNLNINVLSCYPKGNNQTGDIALVKIHTDFPVIYDKENNLRKIEEFFLGMLISGMDNADVEKNPEEVFSIKENYKIKIRLSEVQTGRFMDLDEFETKEKFEKNIVDANPFDIFRFTHICFFQNIELPLEKVDGEYFVIKVLIKHLTGNEEIDENKDWTIQSIYPLTLTE